MMSILRATVFAAVIILTALSTAAAHAQCSSVGCVGTSATSQDITQWPQTCIVRVQESGGVISTGSGVLVSNEPPAILTAYHNLRHNPRGSIAVHFPASGESVTGRLLREQPDQDVALVKLSSSVSVDPVKLAQQDPQPGEHMTVVGFDRGRLFRARAGRLVSYTGRQSSHIVVRVRVEQGASGGPVLNSRGRLVGVLWGCDGRQTYAVCGRRGTRCGILRRLLAAVLRPLRRPEVIVQAPVPGVPPPNTTPSTQPPLQQEPTPAKKPPPEVQPAKIDYERIVTEVVAALEKNPKLRGPEGPQGEPGPRGPKGEQGPQGSPGSDAYITQEKIDQLSQNVAMILQSDLDELTARIEVLEEKQQGPLFYHEASLLLRDKEGNVVRRVELQPKTPVLRGGTLEYVGTAREGAIVDSFRVEERD